MVDKKPNYNENLESLIAGLIEIGLTDYLTPSPDLVKEWLRDISITDIPSFSDVDKEEFIQFLTIGNDVENEGEGSLSGENVLKLMELSKETHDIIRPVVMDLLVCYKSNQEKSSDDLELIVNRVLDHVMNIFQRMSKTDIGDKVRGIFFEGESEENKKYCDYFEFLAKKEIFWDVHCRQVKQICKPILQEELPSIIQDI